MMDQSEFPLNPASAVGTEDRVVFEDDTSWLDEVLVTQSEFPPLPPSANGTGDLDALDDTPSWQD